MDSLSGGTTNLLRMARSESRAAAAFVALALDDDTFATATYRATPEDEVFSGETVDDLIRQAWGDPEFGTGKVLVRMARLASRGLGPGRRMALAIVPLVDGPGNRPWGLLGVVGPEAGSFDSRQIELLERIAQRLSSYFRARQEVREQVAPDVAAGQGAAAPTAPSPTPTAGQEPPAAAPPVPTPVASRPTAISDQDWSAMAAPTPPVAPAVPTPQTPPGAPVAPPAPTQPVAPAPAPPAPPAAPPPSEPVWGVPPRADFGGPPGQPERAAAPQEPPPAGEPIPAPTAMPPAPPAPAWEQPGPPPVPAPEVIWGRAPRLEPGEPAWTPPLEGPPQGTDAQMPSGTGGPTVPPTLGDELVWGTIPVVPSPVPSAGAEQPAWEVVAQAEQPAPAVPSAAAPAEPPTAEPLAAELVTTELAPGNAGTGVPMDPAGATVAPSVLRAEAPAGSDPLADLLRGVDPGTGLVPLGALLGRTGRMLGASAVGGGALVLVVVEVVGEVDEDAIVVAAHALRGQLRFDDPLAQVGDRAFVAAVPLVPGSSTGANVEEHLVTTVRSAIASDAASVRSAHVVADLAGRHDADELLRQAVAKLRAA